MSTCPMPQETEVNPNIVWGESNMSVPRDALFRPLGALAAHERYAGHVGIDGLEVIPVNGSPFFNQLLADAAARDPLPSPLLHPYDKVMIVDILNPPTLPPAREIRRSRFANLILSFHGSIRTAEDNGLIGRFFPTGGEALQEITEAQDFIGSRPLVLAHKLGEDNIRYDDENAPSKDRSFQLWPSTFRDWGLTEESSIEEIKVAMKEHGYHSITLDTSHVRRTEKNDGTKFENPLALTEKLAVAGLIRAVHLSVNRTDMLGLRQGLNPFGKAARIARASKKAFMQSVDAAIDTEDGKLLTAVATQWNTNDAYKDVGPLRIILEDGPFRIGGFGRIRRQHKKIFDTAKKLVAHSVLRPQPTA